VKTVRVILTIMTRTGLSPKRGGHEGFKREKKGMKRDFPDAEWPWSSGFDIEKRSKSGGRDKPTRGGDLY